METTEDMKLYYMKNKKNLDKEIEEIMNTDFSDIKEYFFCEQDIHTMNVNDVKVNYIYVQSGNIFKFGCEYLFIYILEETPITYIPYHIQYKPTPGCSGLIYTHGEFETIREAEEIAKSNKYLIMTDREYDQMRNRYTIY